ncbi:hypothetical protein BGZ60DRAFT_526484 [Tricladium varicosporioides]|nr:hypothetical protein BGZ60DRAFT_526484 [Hymenoscyphus varicosporioides]
MSSSTSNTAYLNLSLTPWVAIYPLQWANDYDESCALPSPPEQSIYPEWPLLDGVQQQQPYYCQYNTAASQSLHTDLHSAPSSMDPLSSPRPVLEALPKMNHSSPLPRSMNSPFVVTALPEQSSPCYTRHAAVRMEPLQHSPQIRRRPAPAIPPPAPDITPYPGVKHSDVRYDVIQQNNDRYCTIRPLTPLNLRPDQLPAPRSFICYFTCDDKLTSLNGSLNQHYAAMTVGDTFSIKGFTARISRIENMNIEITAGSDPRNYGVVGPTDIGRVISNIYPEVAGWASWNTVEVYRGKEKLGSLNEIRQACLFRQLEWMFQGFLTFTKTLSRRITPDMSHDGFQVIGMSGLYRKIRVTDYNAHNEALMLDFGMDLNAELAHLTDDDQNHMFVPIDMRIMSKDGIPAVSKFLLEDAYNDGPSAFTTEHCRRIAGQCGYTNGHAFAACLALGKGHDGGSRSNWSQGRGSGGDEDSLVAFAKRNPNEFFKPTGFEVGLDTSPRGLSWTTREVRAVTYWHKAKISGKIRHWPIPVTRQRLLEIGQRQEVVGAVALAPVASEQ